MSTPRDHRSEWAAFLPYIPLTILNWYGSNTESSVHLVTGHRGILVCVDITGFTVLTRQLQQQGKQGQELLTNILNACFEGLCNAVLAHNGDVLKFAGDALWASFEETMDISRLYHDCRSAIASTNNSYVGQVKVALALHVGAEFGEFGLASLGAEETRLEPEPVGSLVATVFAACDKAEADQLVIGPRLAERLYSHTDVATISDGYAIVHTEQGASSCTPVALQPHIHPEWIRGFEYLSRYVSTEISRRLVGIVGSSSLQSEHRQVSVLFAYFDHTADFDHANSLSAVRALNAILKQVFAEISARNGSVARIDPYRTGHKLMVLFGAPVRHDNDELNAISCAMRLIGMQSPQFRVRIGLTFGPLLCGDIGSTIRREYTVMGDTVNLAARLMSHADWGSILIDEEFRKNLPEAVKTAGHVLSVKGFDQPISCHRFLEIQDAVVSTMSGVRLDRHDNTLKFLEEKWRLALQSTSQLAQLNGPAGVGKTTVLESFRKHAGTTLFVACRQAILFGRGWLLRRLLETLTAQDGIADFPKWFEQTIGPDWLPLFSEMLERQVPDTEWTRGLTPELRETKRRELISSTANQLIRSPLAMLIDDFDCADEFSRSLVFSLADSELSTSVMIVTTSREPLPHGLTPVSVSVSQLGIGAPPTEHWHEYFAKILADGRREREFISHLLSVTDGNPRFITEMVALCKSCGQLIWNQFLERWEFPQSSTAVSVPPTLSRLYLTRFDQLPETVRTVLKYVSVGGDIVHADDLSTLMTDLGELQFHNTLAQLTTSDILRCDSDTGTYTFVQNSMREAIYDCLPRSYAIELHLKFAALLEKHSSHDSRSLSYHYRLAGELAKAFPHALAAGKSALDSYSLHDAARFFEQCAEALSGTQANSVPVLQRLDFYERYAHFLDLEGRNSDSRSIQRRRRRLAKTNDQAHSYFSASIETARLLWKQSKYSGSRKILTFVLSSGFVQNDTPLQADAHLLLAEVDRRAGNFPIAVQNAQTGIALAERCADEANIADGRNKLGLALWGEGKLSEAASCYQEVLASPAAQASRYTAAKAINNLGIIFWELGSFQKALEHLQSAAFTFRDLGDKRNEAYAFGNTAGVAKILGRFMQSSQLYRQADIIFQRLGDRHAHFYTQGNLGDLALILGNMSEAERLYTETLAFAQEIGDKELQAECRVRFGELAYYGGRIAESQEKFTKAIEQAQEIGSAEFYLRGLIGNARLCIGQKDAANAGKLIDQIESEASKCSALIPRYEALYLRGECHRIIGNRTSAIAAFRDVLSYAREQQIFELMLKTNCRLFELDQSSQTNSSLSVQKMARGFDTDNGPITFDDLLASGYYGFFAATARLALAEHSVSPHTV